MPLSRQDSDTESDSTDYGPQDGGTPHSVFGASVAHKTTDLQNVLVLAEDARKGLETIMELDPEALEDVSGLVVYMHHDETC